MMRTITVATGLLLGVQLFTPPSHERGAMPQLSVTQFTLENGLTILVEEDHALPRIAYQVAVRGGSCDDTPWAGSGLAHLMEHMLFKGTTRRPVGSIEQEVRRYEGSMNAFTSYDYTGYTLQTGSAYLADGLDLLADVLFHSTFDPAELTKEQDVVRSEMRMNRDDPDRRLFRNLWGTAFHVHPYRHPVIGYEDVFDRLARDDVVAFFRERYVPNNMVLAIVGDVDTARVRAHVEELFGPQPHGVPFDWSRPAEPAQMTARTRVEQFAVQEAYVMLAFHSTRLQHPDLYPLDVLAQILGQGNSTRLDRRLRREQQLVHRISAWNSTPHDAGLFIIAATADPERVEEVRVAIGQELQQIQAKGVTRAELERAQRLTEADYFRARQSAAGRAGDLASNQLLVGDYAFSQRYVEGIRAVTRADIVRVAQAYLREGAWSWAALVPASSPAAAPAQAPTTTALVWHEQHLPNGIHAIAGRRAGVPLVSIQAVWPGGVRAEPADQRGVAHLMAQLLLGGTTRSSADDIAAHVEERGGYISAFSGKDAFGLSLDLLATDTAFGLQLLKELMTSSTFPEDEVAREKMRVLSKIRARADDIFQVTGDHLRTALFGDHPYAAHPLGTAEHVQQLTAAACQRLYHQWVVPQRLIVLVTGDIEPEATLQLIARVFQGLPQASAMASLDMTAPPALENGAQHIVRLPQRQQAVVALGVPGVAWTDPDRYALEVLQAVLSGSGGRLYQSIREQDGLAYTLGASHVSGQVGGYMMCYVATAPDAAEHVAEQLRSQLQQLQTAPVPAAELELAKRALLDRHYDGLERISSIALQSSLNVLVGLGLDELLAYPHKIQRVTAADVQRVAAAYILLDRAIQVTTLPATPVVQPALEEVAP